MALMKSKQITLTSNVNGEKEERIYNIGRYDGYTGLYMIGLGAELLDSAARKKMLSTDTVFAKKLQDMLKEQGKYIELVTDDGAASLEPVSMLKAAVPDVDIALQLMREVHDYNTALFFKRKPLESLPEMDGEGPRVRQENIGPIVGFILGEKAATIKELREDYDVEDMLNIYESLMVKHANAYWAYRDSLKPKNG
ncbi:tail assembly chaperone [Shewanella sp. phage 1/41]|uniref:tail assembly chaperone n=1 Tax=Shewanella sp. phage 1/41 TaxID=1458861 RepID=UPI0004F79D24|nr:tail assembly chaperone [Shewanella sp. phage 1/41]AHK11693.1 tail assembly chaperone [Shewanella sp. phage 1/41]